MPVFPTLPTDNLYKFIAIFGLVLLVFGFYFPYEKFTRADRQAIDAQRSQKLAQIRIELKQAQINRALNQSEYTAEQLKKNTKSVQDAEAALASKQQSKATESELQTLREQVRQNLERLYKFGEDNQKARAQIDELTEEASTASVNAETDVRVINESKWQANFWSIVGLACAVIGGLMIGGGFYGWYYKVQMHQDTILRKQAGEIKEQTDTLREIVSAEKMDE
jgi:hypothetical protein